MQQTRRLIEIMARLRDPDTGCPWDRRQDFASLIPYTLEEAYEVADAIERGDFADLRDELGDLLLQVAFHSRMAEEQGLFDFEAVAAAIADKLERRHPHVFAGIDFDSDAERLRYWETSKLEEKSEKTGRTPGSVLEGVAAALPALMEAQKLQKRAARHGFDWDAPEAVFGKVREELDELEEAVASGDTAHVREEMGDLLFVLVNLARHLDVDAETALREGNRKFRRRFQFIEECVNRTGKRLADCTLAELDAFWDEAKRAGL
ncbi:nucleoside triphosphate pyrophosphohydrolase [Methylococcus sp. ANG]|uniref:nucleoside triphosphate pyrophosphohydrolase n=1 Tax=unclassified Methylococcus TaxID=2618889 RepID=UPI001C5321E2|nr:nucleoside triphosphate pyrophosphohydrolase [Methylococcus sp. Mc7]QXP85308.1 nucleoside triphosphate pyrophosphohydrolase [Methylococcus sp. Mc7]